MLILRKIIEGNKAKKNFLYMHLKCKNQVIEFESKYQ